VRQLLYSTAVVFKVQVVSELQLDRGNKTKKTTNIYEQKMTDYCMGQHKNIFEKDNLKNKMYLCSFNLIKDMNM
jgi:hypothetical protein